MEDIKLRAKVRDLVSDWWSKTISTYQPEATEDLTDKITKFIERERERENGRH